MMTEVLKHKRFPFPITVNGRTDYYVVELMLANTGYLVSCYITGAGIGGSKRGLTGEEARELYYSINSSVKAREFLKSTANK